MPLLAPMPPRDTHEEHRASTPLELFFDLTFVVAVAQASNSLHHGLVDGDAGDALLSFPLVFFAIWWAWMNFTWFASAYDNDDVAYRLSVFVLMTGVLILAAGIPRAFDDQDFGVITLGYVVMRLAMVALWLRAAARASRRAAVCAALRPRHRGAPGLSGSLRLALPEGAGLVAFFVLVALELSVPVWAEARGRTTWHPRHIAERYGLFTIIVLGESVLGATIGVQTALDLDAHFEDVATVVVGGLLTLFAMWWIYFDMPTERLVERARESSDAGRSGAFAWGYGHYFVFGARQRWGRASSSPSTKSPTTPSSPTCRRDSRSRCRSSCSWSWCGCCTRRTKCRRRCATSASPVAACLILLSSFTPEPVLISGFVLVALVAASVARQPDLG